MILSKIQKQVLLGTILGDGSLLRRDSGKHRLKICHTEKQKGYLYFKRNILKELFLQKTPNLEKNTFSPNNCYSFTSIQNQYLDYYSGLFYRNIKGKRTKIITRKLLNEIDTFGLLIWFLDDGTTQFPTSKNKRSFSTRLATYCFSLNENRAIKIWLWQKYRIESRIQYDKIHKQNYIVINSINSKKLLFLFKKFKNKIPKCMLYKLEPQRLHVNMI